MLEKFLVKPFVVIIYAILLIIMFLYSIVFTIIVSVWDYDICVQRFKRARIATRRMHHKDITRPLIFFETYTEQ
jgi:hypothetical protein